MFWTRPIPRNSVTIYPGRGDAAFTFSDFSLFDWFTVVNAILRNGPDPIRATASLDIRWSGTGERRRVRNDAVGFAGLYENADATIEWSASNEEGYFFSTANSSETHVGHAFTAHVRNGVFYP